MSLRHHRAYATLAVASLALAVGASLTVFSVVNALWLKPVPFPESERLVMVMAESNGADEGAAFWNVESAEIFKVFDAVAGQVVTTGTMAGQLPRIQFNQDGEETETIGVTPAYFDVLGLSIRGRDFTADDNRAGAEPVAIISDRLWSRAFDRRAGVIGSVVDSSPVPLRIIGIAPPDFDGARRGERADLWIPSALVPRVSSNGAAGQDDASVLTMVLARLRPGQTAQEARQQMIDSASNERSRESLERYDLVPLESVFGSPNAATIVINEGRAAFVVAGLAGLVLLAGCATLMSLVVVHYERRRRELSLRLALGATRRRLAWQLTRELMQVAAVGAVAAILVANWSLAALPALSLPGGVDLARLDLSLDWRVLTAGLVVAAVTLLVAAAVPIGRFTRARLAGELVASGSTAPASSERLRRALLGVHVAATVVVLISAGLFVRAVSYGFSAGPGFDIDRTLFLQIQVVPPVIAAGQDLNARRDRVIADTSRLVDALRALPGIDEVAFGPAVIGPLAERMDTPRTVEAGGEQHSIRFASLSGSPGLIEALGVPLLAGRSLTEADYSVRPMPVLMTSSLARRLWPEDDALGQSVSLPAPAGGRSGGNYTVVGVTADFLQGSLTAPPAGVIVNLANQLGGIQPAFVLRSTSAGPMAGVVRELVSEVLPGATRVEIATGRELVMRDLGRQRLGALFFSGFGLVALALGAGGVFGLVAYLAESRRREFGVRLALGATPGDLVRGGVTAGLVPVLVGVGGGLLAAAIVARVFVSVLPGLSPLDPLTYGSVGLLMTACAALAGLAAAWRLRGIAPVDALRAE